MREEAVVEAQLSAPRGKDRVGQHGRAVFVLGQRRSNDEILANAMSDESQTWSRIRGRIWSKEDIFLVSSYRPRDSLYLLTDRRLWEDVGAAECEFGASFGLRILP